MAGETPWIVQFGFGGLFSGVGLLLLYVALGRVRKAWVLFSTPDRVAADAGPGERVVVAGEVEALTDERVTADFLDAEGVLVGTSIERRRSGSGSDTGAGSGRWSVFHDSVDRVPFAVRDETGRIVVEPPTADDVSGNLDFQGTIGIERAGVTYDGDPPRAAAAYERDHDLRRSITDTASPRRVKQGVVTEGEEVHVVGAVRQEGGDLAVSGPADPAVFSLSTDGRPSALGQLLVAAFVGAFGVVATVSGGALLALPYLG